MTPRIEDLLNRARLATTPYPQRDVDAAEARLASRLRNNARQSGPTGGASPSGRPEGEAARDLRILCEAVAGHPGALDELELDEDREEFATGMMPAPAGARVLGCLLYLAQEEEAAQFWWQFAAGAEDLAAAYCLFLHHLAHGEDSAAKFWLAQAATPDPEEGTVSAALRILRLLKKDHRNIPDPVAEVLAYMPVALAYVDDDLDLPLPQPEFNEHIRLLALLANARPRAWTPPARPTQIPRPWRRRPSAHLQPHPLQRPAQRPARLSALSPASRLASASVPFGPAD
ncbi:hypothetical protein [Streptomyces sp. NPDC051561]|uniref:hypothetical protein n=1 Tax=Streptomyces sp. NPDC051561 TaxID=3365658 RepID=UPI0037B7D250